MIAFILISVFIVATVLYNQRRISRNGFVLAMTVLLLIIYLFKDNSCLPDMPIYQEFYASLYMPSAYLSLQYDFEPGYVYLNKAIYEISDNFYLFIISVPLKWDELNN